MILMLLIALTRIQVQMSAFIYFPRRTLLEKCLPPFKFVLLSLTYRAGHVTTSAKRSGNVGQGGGP